jgi:aspartate/methionine/tyrosine aminotransferase
MSILPDFKLETYFSKWEFNTKFNLCASDTESIDLKYLLSICSDKEKELWDQMSFGYTETYGSDILIESISKTYDRGCVDDILTFAGAEEGIYISMKSILNSDDHCIVITPNYQSAQTIPGSICSVSCIDLDPKNNWSIDLETLEKSIRPNTKLISINFPHNPTGKIISHEELNEIINLSRKHDLYLFSDEIYRLMERDQSIRLTQVSDIYEKGISLNGMSKSYGMPGVRIGWVSSKDHKLIDKMERQKHYLSICNSAPSELLSVMALNSRDLILERTRGIIKNNLSLLNTFFDSQKNLFEWKEPDGGCIGFPRLRGEERVEDFCEKLIKEKSVLLLPSNIYDSSLSKSPKNHFRIGFGRLNMPEALDEFKNFISDNYNI